MALITQSDKKILKLADKAFDAGDRITALKYYLKAAENGIVSAMVDCANIYFEGVGGVEQDIDKAIEWFKKAGQLGNSAALNNVGYIYGTLNNYKAAISWYEKSANLGDVVAMLNLSNTYRKEYPNKTLAQKWLKKAESLKDTFSIRKVADYYFWEDVVSNHIEKSIKLYKKAIAMGDSLAFKSLGDIYVTLDEFEQAEECYYNGAMAGDVDCMVELGMFWMFSSEGLQTADYWLDKAIKKGSRRALIKMGDLHARFENYPKARRWYRKAVSKGIPEANEKLLRIKKLIRRNKPNYKLTLRDFDT